MVLGQKRIPFASPDNFDYVPAGSSEEALQFLNDLAVTSNRSVKTLQVCIHNKGQVVKTIVGSKLQCSTALNLV